MTPMQLIPSSHPAQASDARAAERSSGPTWERPAFDQSLLDAGRRLNDALRQQAAPVTASEHHRNGSQAARQRDVQAQQRDDVRTRADEAGRSRRDREAELARRAESTDEDDERDRDAAKRRAGDAASADAKAMDGKATKEAASPGEPQASDEEAAEKLEFELAPESEDQAVEPQSSQADDALTRKVKQLMLAAAEAGGKAAMADAGGPTGQMQDQFQRVVEQIQQAIADGSFAPLEGMLSQSKQALSALAEGQFSAQGQSGSAGPSNVMANLLAQWLGERPGGASATSAVSTAPISPGVVATASSAQTQAGTPALTGSTPAAVALEGLQASSAGESNSGNARTGAGNSGQAQTGSQAQSNASNPSDLNAARLARGLQSAVQQRGGSVTLRLTPPDMGTVRISLQINGGSVNAQFHTQTESARQLLNQQWSQLRHALESQGLNVERLGAQTMSSSSSSQQSSFQQTQQHGHFQSGQHHADGSPNEGRSRGEYGRQHEGEQRGDGQRSSEQHAVGEPFEEVLSEMG